jgi:hypothetical protein
LAYPYSPLLTNRINSTDTGDETQPNAEGFHAKSENDHSRALNDLLTVLGNDPAGSWGSVQERFDEELLAQRSTRSLGLIVHGSVAGTTRPSSHWAYVWRGTVFPTDLVAGRDFYMPTTSDTVGSGGGGGGSNGQEWVEMGNVSGSVTLNMSGRLNTLFKATPTGATTFQVANWTVGAYCEIFTKQPSPTPQSVTLPDALWADRVVGTVSATADAEDRFLFQYCGGLTVHGWIIGKNFGV